MSERRGISHSPSLSPSHLKSSPRPSKPVSASRSLGSSPLSEKAIPNYLKPTLSSLLSGDAIKSNILARRRSFDKPPSPTPTTKPRGFSPTLSFRSSSFSGKTGRAITSPKSDRSLKGTREAGKPHRYARAVSGLKKSATFASKSASRKKDSSDHQESNVAGDEEDLVVGDLELEDESRKADSPTASEVLDADGGDASEVETSPTTLEQRNASIGEAESPTIGEESDDNVAKIESPTLLEQDDADTVSEVDDSAANPDHGKPNEDEGEEAKAPDMKLVDETAEVQQGVGEDDGEAVPRLSHGKKDVGLSNNVIEAMTREQRRNKVRALAGAFETVISLQEHK
ncbi:hypothetical protein SASPL_127755 [Salvia splendens]|uniref:Calmodulin-binding domain-containing protein n=1 Tax=Salvia splendens TaxID=180675 RepID=A0A8X8XCQ1_SALSN|nr:uncharacterized protein LOC121751790 [Salvia splendens]KAG6409713.1 hypothetical protein SASPL_127755 [Salvia splendens]